MRCFIALECPSEVKDVLAIVQDEIRSLGDLKLVEPENLHLTLKFLGEVKDEDVPKVSWALESLQFNSYETTVKGVGVFPKEDYVRVIWAGFEDGGSTKDLAGVIDSIMRSLGFPAEERFHPHITLARVDSIRDKGRLKELLGRDAGRVFGGYTISKVLLMKSVLSPKGPIYSVIKEVKLA